MIWTVAARRVEDQTIEGMTTNTFERCQWRELHFRVQKTWNDTFAVRITWDLENNLKKGSVLLCLDYPNLLGYLFFLSNPLNILNVCFLRRCGHIGILSPLFVQLRHKNYYKIVKQLKSFKIITVASTCFGLHKPSSGSSQPVLR